MGGALQEWIAAEKSQMAQHGGSSNTSGNQAVSETQRRTSTGRESGYTNDDTLVSNKSDKGYVRQIPLSKLPQAVTEITPLD